MIYYLTLIMLAGALLVTIFIATQIDSSNNIVDKETEKITRRGISKAKTARFYNVLFVVIFVTLFVLEYIFGK